MSKNEQKVRDFYNKFGWTGSEGGRGEDELFRQHIPQYYPYHRHVDERTKHLFDGMSGTLLIAGCGDLPNSHLDIADQFSRACCIDISEQAIAIAQRKFGAKADYVLGSILGIPRSENSFEAAFCAHVIYHIDKKDQERAVRELIRVVCPGGRVVIIYANPDSMGDKLLKRTAKLPLLWRLQRQPALTANQSHLQNLYYHAYPLEWWMQFSDQCDLSYLPWDVLSSYEERAMLIRGVAAWAFYRTCAFLETHYPEKVLKYWSYPVIMLTKKIATA